MKKVLVLLVTLFSLSFSLDSPYNVIYSESSSGKLNINFVSEEEMLKAGIAPSYIGYILDFRNTKGSIESMSELVRVSGIGQKTVEKLEKYFIVENAPEAFPLKINKADDKTLLYYGFSKNEIKDIREYLNKNKKFSNSVELKKIIPNKKYEKYKNLIIYDMY